MSRFLLAVAKTIIVLSVLAVCFFSLFRANAESITLNAIDSGWYSSGGFHESINENYVVGRRDVLDYNNFFAFDLSGIGFTIKSAELRILNPANAYQSPSPIETFTLFEVSTPVSTLKAGGSSLKGIYTDLGSGVSYGSQTISARDNNSIIAIPLNAAGIMSLNRMRGKIYAVGGSITTLFGSEPQTIFGSTDASSIRQLVITVP